MKISLHLYYKLFLIFSPDIISFQHVFHLGVGRSQIEWKLKAKTLISVFPWAKIGQNDHSNPYIESTTVLSDIFYRSLTLAPIIRGYSLSLASIKRDGETAPSLPKRRFWAAILLNDDV